MLLISLLDPKRDILGFGCDSFERTLVTQGVVNRDIQLHEPQGPELSGLMSLERCSHSTQAPFVSVSDVVLSPQLYASCHDDAIETSQSLPSDVRNLLKILHFSIANDQDCYQDIFHFISIILTWCGQDDETSVSSNILFSFHLLSKSQKQNINLAIITLICEEFGKLLGLGDDYKEKDKKSSLCVDDYFIQAHKLEWFLSFLAGTKSLLKHPKFHGNISKYVEIWILKQQKSLESGIKTDILPRIFSSCPFSSLNMAPIYRSFIDLARIMRETCAFHESLQFVTNLDICEFRSSPTQDHDQKCEFNLCFESEFSMQVKLKLGELPEILIATRFNSSKMIPFSLNPECFFSKSSHTKNCIMSSRYHYEDCILERRARFLGSLKIPYLFESKCSLIPTPKSCFPNHQHPPDFSFKPSRFPIPSSIFDQIGGSSVRWEKSCGKWSSGYVIQIDDNSRLVYVLTGNGIVIGIDIGKVFCTCCDKKYIITHQKMLKQLIKLVVQKKNPYEWFLGIGFHSSYPNQPLEQKDAHLRRAFEVYFTESGGCIENFFK
ncbi:hypothetical protein ADUPG1_012656 [Aduncisulcus paluster]|uniref:Uncharacterized protein n=1 Tax=Aduncisulcus paluster TaxID=2918883 RepID=A0ABQ5K4F2_9EUKA|nr:hypothetical protein ADUPG1_012656 [Aduncisulcus paluster]